MDLKHRFQHIDKATFDAALLHYRSPDGLADGEKPSDIQRYKTIPDAVKARGVDPYLEKEELVTLVTWKLKHGTFRPALKAMAQQNGAHDVEETTRCAFAEVKDSKQKDAIKTLTGLRGIGPATASLMLSVYDMDKAPFFSDELFRWSFFDSGKGNGWDRRIKYTAREYFELYDKVQQLLQRLNVRAVDAEKVAYVLGNEGLPAEHAQEDISKSLKRKAGEMGNVAAADGESDESSANIGTTQQQEEVKQEKRRRGLAEKSPPNEVAVDPVAETTDGKAAEAKSTSRPKRRGRK